MSRAAYYGLSTAAYGLVLLALAAFEGVLMRGLWRPFDIASYYGLAASAASSIGAIMDFAASPPMLLLDGSFFAGYGIFVTAAFCLASAVLILEIGRRLYGDAPGFLAGLLFVLNVAGAMGHMTIAEALALTLALLSAYTLLFSGMHAVTGLCVGAAACFKPLALLLVPASLLFMYKKGRPGDLLVLAGTALLPPVLIVMAALVACGDNVLSAAASSGFEAVGLITEKDYRSPDALMAVANIVLSVCMLASLLPLALLGFSREHGPAQRYMLAAGLCFIAMVALKQYLHYWAFALPFLALLCAGALGRRRPDE